MNFHPDQGICPKCNVEVNAQNRTRTRTIDVAHDRQTVSQALQQFRNVLELSQTEKFGKLRVIVGTGKIRDELEQYLAWLQEARRIKSFQRENGNPGTFLVVLLAESDFSTLPDYRYE